MKIALTQRGRPFDDQISMTSDEFLLLNSDNPHAIECVNQLVKTGEPQYFNNFIISRPPFETDPDQRTQHNIEPAVEPEKQGMITDFELRAIQGVEIAEMISDPISKSNLAKSAIRLGCSLARVFR